ncbi:MAG: hypothetical protein KGI75_13500 [Rhizobiaceae bacterium]|nr:hypothetical protein [Rhizobiaceae bacterium]
MPNDKVKTIVFLPLAAADFVVANLERGGYEAMAVHTVSELHEALCSSEYALAVTARPDIDLVRHLQAIPVVNIEVFFDFATERSRDGTPRRFDAKSFLTRVDALTASPQFGKKRKDQSGTEPQSRSRFYDLVELVRNIADINLRKCLRRPTGS